MYLGAQCFDHQESASSTILFLTNIQCFSSFKKHNSVEIVNVYM